MSDTPKAGPYLVQVPILPIISGMVDQFTKSRPGTFLWDQKIASVNRENRLFQGFRVVMPKTNFVDPKTGLDKLGGTFRARKFVKDGKFCFWIALVPVKG